MKCFFYFLSDARETQCPQTVSVIWKLTPMVIVTSEPQRQSVGPKKNCTNWNRKSPFFNYPK